MVQSGMLEPYTGILETIYWFKWLIKVWLQIRYHKWLQANIIASY